MILQPTLRNLHLFVGRWPCYLPHPVPESCKPSTREQGQGRALMSCGNDNGNGKALEPGDWAGRSSGPLVLDQ